MNRSLTLCLASVLFSAHLAWAAAPSLHEALLAEDLEVLVREALTTGDAARGAVVFHRPQPGCSKCHVAGGSTALAPDLSRPAERFSDRELVESILAPSKAIRQGYQAAVVVLKSGTTSTGMLEARESEFVALRDLTAGGRLVRFPLDEVDEVALLAESPMPSGQADLLTSRQEFLDLVRYVMEIRDGGPQRAAELEPSPAQIALKVPDYEQQVDHAGLLRDLDDEAFERGRELYHRFCANCHGTPNAPGSLPTSLRFADGQFKNGSDPYSIYRTLTYGFGQMVPQTWMVPQQKYDVIHYVREAYLRELNPDQYVPITSDYLASLPRGTTRGPAPQDPKPWISMDYGPMLIGTYEIGQDGSNLAYKGIAIRLDAGPGGISRGRAWMVFEHDTLRMAGAWSGEGFIDWQCIHFDGQHAVHPHIVGRVHLSNPNGPGWARPGSHTFADTDRVVGRDGRRYGPLPRSWGRFRGIHRHGHYVILEYTVGDARILERPGLVPPAPDLLAGSSAAATTLDERPVFARLLNIGPRPEPLVLQVGYEAAAEARQVHHGAIGGFPSSWVVLTSNDGSEASAAERSSDVQLPAARDASDRSSSAPAAGDGTSDVLVIGMTPEVPGAQWKLVEGNLRLALPAGPAEIRTTLWFARVARAEVDSRGTFAAAWDFRVPDEDLEPLLDGGPPLWPSDVTTQIVEMSTGGPFDVEQLEHPERNPWLARVRPTGLDFLPGGDEAVVCMWDGDVWRVRGLKGKPSGNAPSDGQADNRPAEPSGAAAPGTLRWQRIASGLFQPLGIKFIDGKIYVACRDQIVILDDRNGDGETDFYRTFNSDHQVTEHFHEFAMGLEVGPDGSLYYAKSARHALRAVVPHHGTLLRVSPDGSQTEIIATGFRAANGVCLNPDGTFFVTDQEGHWTPKNRINWVRRGGFYGNLFGYHSVRDRSDEAMEPPVCWITNAFDRSPAELRWVDAPGWGPLEGALLSLSYGYGKVFAVLTQRVGEQMQGGLCALPGLEFPTGIIRGRFHPEDHQFYLCGMFAWAGSKTEPGGVYRVRYTGRPLYMPLELNASAGQLELHFSEPLDPLSAVETDRYRVRSWSLRRSREYGSPHLNERALEVERVEVSEDGRTVRLKIPALSPDWCLETRVDLIAEDGTRFQRTLHHTIHTLEPASR